MFRKNVVRGVLAASISAMVIGMSGQYVNASEFVQDDTAIEMSVLTEGETTDTTNNSDTSEKSSTDNAVENNAGQNNEENPGSSESEGKEGQNTNEGQNANDGQNNNEEQKDPDSKDDNETDLQEDPVVEIAINEENFPDPVFRQLIAETYDLDKNQSLCVEECEAVEILDVSEKGITSLKGIENFTKLISLKCEKNKLTELDVSACARLVNLLCYQNELTSLDVSHNEKLQKLYCYANPLTTLNISNCKELEYIAANDCELTTLNVSDCEKLTDLFCHRNKLTSLVLGQHNFLRKINMGVNEMQYINIGGCPILIDLIQKAKQMSVAGNENGACYVTDTASIYFDKNTKIFKSEPVKLTVDVKVGRKGYVTGGGLYEIGDEVTIVGTPMKGNKFTEWWINHSAFASTEATYTFTIQGDTSMTAVFSEVPLTNLFEDVQRDAWYLPYIRFVYEKEIMNGKGKKTPESKKELFSPLGKITRAEFATTLYNMEKRPEIPENEKKTNFKDVESGKWYYEPIIWLYNQKITDGYSKTQFGSFDNITREQMAQMLYKYCKMKGYDVSLGEGNLKKFGDYKSVSDWATDAMIWATENKIINGDNSNPPKLNPKGDATRAECATMLNNLYQRFEAQPSE